MNANPRIGNSIIYLYICMHVYICISVYMHTCIHLCVCIHVFICVYAYMYTSVYIHLSLSVYLHLSLSLCYWLSRCIVQDSMIYIRYYAADFQIFAARHVIGRDCDRYIFKYFFRYFKISNISNIRCQTCDWARLLVSLLHIFTTSVFTTHLYY